MMGFFDKLKKIIHIDIAIDFRKFVNINIISKSDSSKIELDSDKKSIDINLEKLSPKELADFKELIKSSVTEDGKLILGKGSKVLIEDFKAEEKTDNSKALLTYFKDKIPQEDYEALRASLYIRELFRKGDTDDVERL